MAYMSQEHKKELAPAIMAVCKKYNVKASLGVDNHSTLVLKIKSSPIDFIGNFNQSETAKRYERNRHERGDFAEYNPTHMEINEHHFKDQYTGDALNFLTEVIDAMMKGNHDNSDIMTDYFDVGWYISVNVGTWDKPYILL